MTVVLISVGIFAGLGILFGLVLALASRVFAVKTDPRVEQIIEALPGANCGGCGYSGCAGFAEAVVKGEAPANACRAGGEAAAKRIGEVMGIEVQALEPMRAEVLCSGGCGKAKEKCNYEGAHDCIAADRMYGGAKACPAGCMGLGTCVDICRYDALSVVDGVAKVDPKKCTGCGACAQVCPKHLIEMIPRRVKYSVVCHSPESAKETRQYCDAGCIGCKLCQKNCPNDAIRVTGALATIDYNKCTSCGICAQKCPRKIIRLVRED
ncbi:MAG: Fe-S cluster domain-containing protein [Ruminococcaceae bacterium]|nr:Fe-S cluster domain-containing protein [Oscillospiraceae bacterium]